MYRKSFFKILVFSFSLALFGSLSSCKTGEGCNQERYHTPTDKDGNLSTKKGKSGLFSKKQKKRMGK